MTNPTQAQLRWALRYNGLERLASGPVQLEGLLGSARDGFAATGDVPEWCGVDLLRGWAFWLSTFAIAADSRAVDVGFGDEWTAVLRRLTEHPGAHGVDRPPADFGDGISLPSVFSDVPRMHKDSAFLAAKQARWWEDHVAPINQFVDHIHAEIAREWADQHGDEAPPVFVPYVDPDSGGVLAKVLLLLESPSGPAALGSRMLSADNDDGTAMNVWSGYANSWMPRTYGLHWNAVPWYIGDGKTNKNVNDAQVGRARRYLNQLLDLAPDVRVVLALGIPAQDSVAKVEHDLRARGIDIVHAPHPSPRPAARSKGKSLLAFNDAMTKAYRIADGIEETSEATK
jgi:hypothetical protein